MQARARSRDSQFAKSRSIDSTAQEKVRVESSLWPCMPAASETEFNRAAASNFAVGTIPG
jgi:hypothetical protein